MFDFAKRKHCANRLTNIMRGMAAAAPTLLLALTLTSCMSDGYTDTTAGQSDTYINLNVSTPTAQARANASASAAASTSETLGQDETAPSPEEEEKIYSIRVWAFKSGTDKSAMPIGFKSETGLNEKGTHRVSMKLLRKTAEGLENIDLYILLNAESIGVLNGSNLNTLTRADLETAVISNPFGINTEDGTAQTTAVPSDGLPISRAITNINVKDNISDSETQAAQNPVSVPLVRAVSKLHFFFARKDNKDTQGVEITKIEVDESVIASTSPVFPEAATDAEKATQGLTGNLQSLAYLNQKLTFGGVATSDIHAVSDPTTYVRQTGEAAQDYMTRLSTAVKESYRSYLRETGKPLTGKIYYKSSKSGEEKSATFEVSNAYRNHELVVYGYFLGDSETDLTLQYYVANWNQKTATDITFN